MLHSYQFLLHPSSIYMWSVQDDNHDHQSWFPLKFMK
jgi:hypothetical protein